MVAGEVRGDLFAALGILLFAAGGPFDRRGAGQEFIAARASSGFTAEDGAVAGIAGVGNGH